MKKILFINTGGTIASVPGKNGLAPGTGGIDPVSLIPDLAEICEAETLSLFELDSTDIRPSHWLALSRAIRKRYERYDGFVIAHGTDTIAYTAAGLSHLIENSVKPVVLTGSQIPACREGSDAPENLRDAFFYAACDMAFGVHVVFAGHVIGGTRARKIRTNSADSIVSVNAPDDAFFKDDFLVVRQNAAGCPGNARERENIRTVFRDRVNENIWLVKLFPGISRDFLEYAYTRSDGLVLETFGCGGIPEYTMFEEIVRTAKKQTPVTVCTQVLYEGTDLQRYDVGRRLLSLPNITEGGKMTAEAAYAAMVCR